MQRLNEIWLYVAQTPLFWLTMTVTVYQVATFLYRRAGMMPLLNPVLIAMMMMVAILQLSHTPYKIYFNNTQFIHFLLGPATVALAIPLYGYYHKLKLMLIPILGALMVGSLTGIISAVALGWLMGLSRVTLLSLMAKSVTTPIAMGISEQVGGLPSLTAVFVIITGIIGAVIAPTLLDLSQIKEDSVRGFAIGLSSHGLGTARAFQMNEETGAFSGLGMGLNGLLTAILVPLLVWLWG